MSSPRVVAICALALSIAAPLAIAATPQEEERKAYKAQVEPICQKNSEENDDILKGVREKVNKGKLAAAGAQFTRASTALRGTLTKLKAVPQPPDDAARLTEWLKGVGDQVTLLQQVGKALKESKRRRAETLATKLDTGARHTNALVVSFSFRYCRFESTIAT